MSTSQPEGQPKVTILTAAYNSLEGLRRTVASVSSQTYAAYEHVVVDGGSSDGTADWLEQHGESIKWISEPDEGIADALNKGLKMASGEWVLVLHAEDTFEGPNSLRRATDMLSPAADVVCFDVMFAAENRVRTLKTSGLKRKINIKPFPHQGAFTRSTLFERVGAFDESFAICMDYDFYLRAYRAGVRSVVEHSALTRMPGTGVSSRVNWAALRARFGEERAVHERHSPNALSSFLYKIYWPMYLGYRWTRSRL